MAYKHLQNDTLAIVDDIIQEFQSAGYAVFHKLNDLIIKKIDNFFIIPFKNNSLYEKIRVELGGDISKNRVKNIINFIVKSGYFDEILYKNGLIFSENIVKNYLNYDHISPKTLLKRCGKNIENIWKSKELNKKLSMTYEEYFADKFPINPREFPDESPPSIYNNSIYNNSKDNNSLFKDREGLEKNLFFPSPFPFSFAVDSWEYITANELVDSIQEDNPDYKIKNETFQNWLNVLNQVKMEHMQNDTSPEHEKQIENEINKIIRFARQDVKYWKKGFLSPKLLLNDENYLYLKNQSSINTPSKYEYTYNEMRKLINEKGLSENDFTYYQTEDGQHMRWYNKGGPCPYLKKNKPKNGDEEND